jgi:hypothetical protein
MGIHQIAEGIFKDLSDRYKTGSESAFLSNPTDINGKLYREITFNKTLLGKPNKKISGTLYVTENGEQVSDVKIKRQIASTTYYTETIFDEAYLNSLNRAITPEKDIEKEEADYETVIAGLEVLKGEGIDGTDTVAKILLGLPGLKRENNKAIEDFIRKLEVHKQLGEDAALTKASIDDLLTYYRNILIKNFKRVKFISTGKENFDKISDQVSKRRKNIKTKLFDRQGRYVLNKIDHTLSHLQRIIVTYQAILNMSEAEYIKYLDKMDEAKIKNKLEVSRI